MTQRYDRRLALRAAAADADRLRALVESLVAEIGLAHALELVRHEARIAGSESERCRRRYFEHGRVEDDDRREAAEARQRALLGVLVERHPAVDLATRTTALVLDLHASGDCGEDRRVIDRAVAELGLKGAVELLEGEIAQAESVAGLFAQVADRDDDRYLALEDADLQRTKAEDWTALLRELARGQVAA